MAEQNLKTYRGNCHCGDFVYEVDLPADMTVTTECNCSICSKKGYLFAVPAPGSFRMVKGDEKDMTAYTFGPGTRPHSFCPKCGTGLLARSDNKTPPLVINIRAIQGPLDVWSMEKKLFDGAATPGDWKAAEYKGPEPKGGPPDAKTYHGSCHCGAVTVAVRFKPLDTIDPLDQAKDDERVIECNCSICQRNGVIWLYPRADQVVIQGRENTTLYAMGAGHFNKPFCKTCGVPITNEAADLTPEQIAAMPERRRFWWDASKTHSPINLRLLDDFDFKSLKTRKFDGYKNIPGQYQNP